MLQKNMNGDCTEIPDLLKTYLFGFLKGGQWQCTASAVLIFTEDWDNL